MTIELFIIKAWKVSSGNNDWDGYCIFVHADTAGQAKSMARQVDPGNDFTDTDFIDLRAVRCKELDGRPFTYDALHEFIGFYYRDEDGREMSDDEGRACHENFCQCSICKPSRGKNYWVDQVHGSDKNTGLDPDKPTTMAHALEQIDNDLESSILDNQILVLPGNGKK